MEAPAFPLCLTVKTPISYLYANLGRVIRNLSLRIRQIKLTQFAAGGVTGSTIAYVFDAVC